MRAANLHILGVNPHRIGTNLQKPDNPDTCPRLQPIAVLLSQICAKLHGQVVVFDLGKAGVPGKAVDGIELEHGICLAGFTVGDTRLGENLALEQDA